MITQRLTLLAEHDGSKERLLELIQSCGFFSDLDLDEIEMLGFWVKAYSAPARTTILHEGDAELLLCIVVEGVINIFKKVHTEEEHVKVAEILAGASFGEMGVIDRLPLSATAVVAEDAVILTVTAEDFQNLITRNSNLGVKILLKLARILVGRLRSTTSLWADLFSSRK